MELRDMPGDPKNNRIDMELRLEEIWGRPDETYAEYINGPEWKHRASKLKNKIGVCQEEGCNKMDGLEVHHTDYRYLGCEPERTLRCLCRYHHKEAHNLGD